MGPTRRLVTIKRSGVDGPHFPLSLSSCLFGRAIECDIRIQLPVVSKQHCKIEIRDQEAVLLNFSSTNPTQVNGSAIEKPVQLKHGDVITIVDRSFRYENESDQNGRASAESPGQRREQEPSHRASRSSFSSNPGGKGQDASVRSKVTEEDVSGRALAHVTKAPEARNVSEDPAARRTPHGVHPSGQAAEDSRKAPDPAAGDWKEDSSVALGSRSGELKAFSSMQCLRNGEQGDSPFRRLYESMKVELDVKSASVDGPQSRRKSGSQGPRTTEGESAADGVQTPGSLTPRPKSGRSPQTKADPAGGQPGRGRSLEKGSDGEPAQSPSLPRTGTQRTRTPTPGRAPQPSPRRRRSKELRVSHGSESPCLGQGQSEGFRADSKAWMPRKFLPRNQTPVKVEEADSFATTPEKFSKKRKSISTNADDLATAVEMQAISAPLVLQAERKNQSDVLNKPEKLGTAAGQMGPGLPGLSSADISGFSDPMKKTEGVPPKRRRVSFGGRLRPELFDENLPPNTPLKRGETPKQRRSLATHTPAVLKKIIKEQPQPSGKEDSSETHRETTAQHARLRSPAPPASHASPAAPDRCRGSAEVPSVSSGSTAPHQPEPPERGGRKSGSLPLKRASLDRGQHGILQMIYSRRRSGASEANLIVAKSWADVVRLGAKQTQSKAVKRGPPRPLSKKPRRTHPPKKPTDVLQNQFSTGHANSPCTIVVGRAHLEKVTGPARPCRTLNSFVPHKPMDFGEDLSGLTEMFKTPAKEKPHRMSTCASTFSNPEDLLGKKLLGPHPGEKPLLCTPEIWGGDVSLGPEDSPKEPADRSSESPVLRRPPIRMNESIAKTPRSVSKTTGAELKSPGSEAELPKAASSANRPRRSSELRGPQMPGPERQAAGSRPHTVQDALGRRLGNTPLAKPELEGERRDSERPFESGKENVESKESSAKTPAGRRSGAASEVKCEPAADLIPVEAPPESEPPGAAQVDGPGLWQTPARAKEAADAENRAAGTRCKPPGAERAGTTSRRSAQLKTPSQKGDPEGPSAPGKPAQTPGATTPVRRAPGDGKSIKLFRETPEQKWIPAEGGTGSKRRPRTPKEKTRPLEDLAGLRELFQTPQHAKDPMAEAETPGKRCQPPRAAPVLSLDSITGPLKTPPQRANTGDSLSALRQPRQMPGGAGLSYRNPEGGDRGTAGSQEAPEQSLDSAEHVTGSKRRPRTPKEKTRPLEDLAGLRELFQTPQHAKDPGTDNRTPKTHCQSPQPEPVNTPSRKGRLKTPSQKGDTDVELSAPRTPRQTPGGAKLLEREPESGDRGAAASREAPEQNLDAAERGTGVQRRPRTPRERAQSLEDLAGFQELFQTPLHTKEPMAIVKTPHVSRISPQPEATVTPTNRKRQLRTPLGKVVVEAGGSAPGKPTRALGETPHTHSEPGGGGESIRLFQETPKQKLDAAENAGGSKRRPRMPRERAQSLEDLAGFQELFQTPLHTKEPMAIVKTPHVSRISPQPEATVTPTNRKRQLRTPLGKVVVEAGGSAPGKPTQALGETPHMHSEPGGGGESIRLFQETPKQKLDAAENAGGSKRRPRTPRERAQSLEDLAGFQELFQTPLHTKEPMAIVKTPHVSRISPQPEATVTPTNRKRQLRTPLGKVVVEAGGSAPGKPTRALGETPHTHSEPGGGGESIRLFQETPKQKLDAAENAGGSKRRPRMPRERAQSLEDLAGFQELFQTPLHTKEPMAIVKTPHVSRISPQPEATVTPTNRKRQLRTPLGKVVVEAGGSAPGKPTRALGETPHTHSEPGGGGESIRLFQETPKQKLDAAENAGGSKRRPRMPRERAQSLEDLAGFQELFQTPLHTKEPMAIVKTPHVSRISPQPEATVTPTNRKRQLRTPLGKVVVEAGGSAPGKPTQALGETPHMHSEPGGGGESIRLFQETPKQKLDAAENAGGSKRRPRMPRERAQSLEDLAGFQELFQTPPHADDPVTGDKTSKTEPVNTPASGKRGLRTPPQKVEVLEGVSGLRQPRQTPGDTVSSRGGDRGTAGSQEAPEQSLDSIEHITGIKRRTRTPKEKTRPLEDLAGLRELFQTPQHAKDPGTDNKTPKTHCQSPQPEPVNTPSRKGRLKTPSQKGDTDAELSAPRTPRQTPGGAKLLEREPESGDRGAAASREAPEQNLDAAERGTGVQRRPRTPRERAQSLEDLAGFQELFQTPLHTKEPMAIVKTPHVSRISPQPEATVTPTNRKRQLRTPLGKVVVEAGGSAPGKPTRALGETPHTHSEPGGGGESIRLFQETPKQKLDAAENAGGSKRRPRMPRERAQSLEDLAGFQELFQTPLHTKEPMAIVKTPHVSRISPQPEATVTPTNRKRQLRTPLGKVVVEAGGSAPGKPTQALGETPHMHSKPGGGGESIRLFQETPKQKLDAAENAGGSKRRPRMPRERAQSLEDLAGFQELFQTPLHTKEPMAIVKTPHVSRISPQPEATVTPTNRKRQLRTPLGKVVVEAGGSAPGKPTRALGETPHTHSEPGGGGESIRLFQETPKQKLDAAENAGGSKRRPRMPRERAQSLEDLAGFQELFQTPLHTKEPMAIVKTPHVSRISPQPEATVTPTNRKRQLRTPLGKVVVEAGGSAPGKPTRALGETPHTHSEPGGGGESIRLFQETPKQKLDAAENAGGSKRRPRMPRERAQSLEDLAGFQELFQTPPHADDPVTGDKTPKTPCLSPKPEPVNTPVSRKRRLRTPPQKVGTDAELSAPRKTRQTPEEAKRSDRGPAAEEEDKAFKKMLKQKLDSAENEAGEQKRPRRTLREKVPPLEDPAGLQELFQTPRRPKDPVADDIPTKMPCTSPPAEPVTRRTTRQRRLRSPPGEVDAEGPSAPRRPTRAVRETRTTGSEPAADEKDITVSKRTSGKELNPAESVSGVKSRLRTSKEKSQPVEDEPSLREPFPKPDQATEEAGEVKIAAAPCPPPPVGLASRPTRQRRLRSPPGDVDAEGPSAPRRPTRAARETRTRESEPAADEKDITVFKETLGPNLDSADEVVGTKSRLRSHKEKAQPPGGPGGVKEPFPRPDQAKEEAGEVKIAAAPCPPPPAGPASRPTRQRRLGSPPGEVDAEGPSAPRRPTRAARETRATGSEPAADEKDITVFKETLGPNLDSADEVVGTKSRLRSHKEKAQPPGGPGGVKEPFPRPDQAKEEAGEVKIAAAPCPPPPAGPASRPTRQRRLGSPPGEVDAEGPSAPRRPTRAARETRTTGSEPAADEKDITVFKETLGPNLDSADEVVGTKSRLRSHKEKAQPPGGPGGVKEPFPRPDQAKEEAGEVKIAAAPCPPPPAGPASRPTRQRWLRSPPRDVEAEGPSVPRRPTRAVRETRTTGSEPAADEKDIAVSKRTSGKELNPAKSVSGVKSRLRTSKEKSQPVEDEPSLPKPDQATEEAGEVKIAAAPCPPLPAGPASRPTRQRRLRSPPGDVDAEGPSAPRRPTRAARETRTRESEPAADEKDITVFKETSGPNLDSVDEVFGTRSRLRSHKEKAQPPGGPGGVKEPFPRPDQSKGLGNDAADVKTALRPTAGRRRPAETSRSDLRASKVRSTEDPGGTSPSESHASPQREQGEAGRASGRKRLRPETAMQEPEDEKPLQKRQRAAPRERGDLPDPMGMKQKSLRVAVQRTEPVGKLPEGDLKTDAAGPGDAAGAPDKGMSLHPRRPNKTDLEEQRPECLPSAEKMRRTRHEKKSVKTSSERALRGREDGAENPTSGGKVQERQVRSRSGEQNKTLSPDAAEGKAREKRAEIRRKDQEEKEATEHSGLATGLRSRKTTVRPRGNPSERDSEPRVTPRAKRGAHSLQKEDDNVSVRKIRTRSQKSSGR